MDEYMEIDAEILERAGKGDLKALLSLVDYCFTMKKKQIGWDEDEDGRPYKLGLEEYGQGISALKNLLFDDNNIDKAKDVLEYMNNKAMDEINKAMDEATNGNEFFLEIFLEILADTASFYSRFGDHEKSQQIYVYVNDKFSDINEGVMNVDDHYWINLLMQAGKESEIIGDNQKALDYYKKMVEISKERYKWDRAWWHNHLVDSYNCLRKLYSRTGDGTKYKEINEELNQIKREKKGAGCVSGILQLVFDNAINWDHEDSKSFQWNIELTCSGGMADKDRSISRNRVDFLIDHVKTIRDGLIVYQDIRNRFMEAVSTEIVDYVSSVRSKMKSDSEIDTDTDTGEKVVIDLSQYKPSIEIDLRNRLEESLYKDQDDERVYSLFLEELTEKDISKIGYIACNYIFLLRALEYNKDFFDYVRNMVKNVEKQLSSESKWNNKDYVVKAVKIEGWRLKYASEELRADKEVVLEAVRNNGVALQFADEKIRGDRDVVLEAVKSIGLALPYASEELRGDKEVVFEAVKNYGPSLQHASENLREDREFVLEAVKNNGSVLQYANESFRGDREVVLEAVKQDGYALEYASEELRDDKEIVLNAVKQYHDRRDGDAVYFASERLRKDKDILREAVKNSPDVLAMVFENDKEFAKELYQDREIMFLLSKNDADFLEEILKDHKELADEVLKNKQIVLDLMDNSIISERTFEHISKDLWNNKEIVMKIIDTEDIFLTHEALWYIGEDLWNDKEFVKEILRKVADLAEFSYEYEYEYDKVLDYIGEKLWNDKEFILFIIQLDATPDIYNIIKHFGEEQWNDKDVVTNILLHIGGDDDACLDVIDNMGENLWNDKDIVISILRECDDIFYDRIYEKIGENLWNNREVVLEAVKQGVLIDTVDDWRD